jgi:uncharacterized protein involved in exopolysaccharide biosynthesis
VILVITPLYTSEAKLFVRLGRESVGLDPTATTGQTVSIQETREAEINSVYELLVSREVFGAVVDDLGAAEVLGLAPSKSPPKGASAAAPTPIWMRLNPLATYDDRDEAIRKLAKRVQVEAVRKSNIVNVACDAPTPELARRVCERLLTRARELHLRVNRTAGSLDFFTEQTRRQTDRVAALEDELRQLKNKTGLSAVDTQRDLLVKQIASLDENRIKAAAGLNAAEAEIRLRRETLDTLPLLQVTAETRGHAQNGTSRLREQLYALELREKELVSKYQEDTFFVQQVRDQIAEARKVLSSEIDPVERTTSLNQMHQLTQQSLIETTARASGLKAEMAAWAALADESRRALERFNRDEIELSKLTRQLNLEVDTLRKFSENREVARIDQALRDQSISNLNILQPPTLSHTPSKPRVTMYLSLGLVLAAFAALAVGAVADWRERTPADNLDEEYPPSGEWRSRRGRRRGAHVGNQVDEDPSDDDDAPRVGKNGPRRVAH